MGYPKGKRYLWAIRPTGVLIVDKKKGYSVRLIMDTVQYRKLRTQIQNGIARDKGTWVPEDIQDLVQYVVQKARRCAHVRY